jgi:hypothetical protein
MWLWLWLWGLARNPCGGGVEYLHHDLASRRRRRKGKSQIWDSGVWSQVPRDSDPTVTALVGDGSIYKRQIRPLVREGAPQKQDRNCQTVINIWSCAPDGARHQDLLTDCQSQCAFYFYFDQGNDRVLNSVFSVEDSCGKFVEDKKTSYRFEVIVSVWRSIARRRPVKTGNPSACVTVNCKSVISLYWP